MSETNGDPRTQKERMAAGALYQANDAELGADRRRARRLVEDFNRSGADDDAGRRRLLAALLGGLGPDTVVRPPLHCDYGYHLHLGARTFVNFGLVALDVAAITIGDDVQIGPNVQLLAATHPTDVALRRARWEYGAPITVEDDVWLGGGAVVLPGVRVGAGTVVGAGAVVTRDLPAGAVAVGNPARVVRAMSPGA